MERFWALRKSRSRSLLTLLQVVTHWAQCRIAPAILCQSGPFSLRNISYSDMFVKRFSLDTPGRIGYTADMQRETVFSSLLKRLRTRAGISKTELARRLGVTFTTVHNWEEGNDRPPPPERVKAIAKALGLNPEDAARLQDAATLGRASPEILAMLRRIRTREGRDHDAPQPERRRAVPLYGEIPAGPPVEPDQAVELYQVLEHLARPGRYVLRVKGDSMAPTLLPDDLVLMEYVSEPDLNRLNNRICAVLLEGESTLKRLQVQRIDGGHTVVILKGDRADYPTESFVLGKRDFQVLGVVLRIVDRRLG